MEYNFEKFKGRNTRLESRITITKSKSIGFPTKFFIDQDVNKYKFVVLFYDRNKKAVAIHFTNDENKSFQDSRFSISKHKGYGASVIAQSFFKTYDIDTQKVYNRYEWKQHHIDGVGKVYVIELKERNNKKAIEYNETKHNATNEISQ